MLVKMRITVAGVCQMKRYCLLPEKCVIRVYHADIDQSWYRRGKSQDERDMKAIETTIKTATGLRHVCRKHGIGYVDLRLRPALFSTAAVAVRLMYTPDPDFERFLRQRTRNSTDAGRRRTE